MKNEFDPWEAFWSEAKSWRNDRPGMSTALVPVQPKVIEVLSDHGVHATVVRTIASPHRLSRLWRVVGRGVVGLFIAGCGVAIAVTSMQANAWFGHSLTTDPTAGQIFSHLSVLAEIVACTIPTANRFYFQAGDWLAVRGFVLMAVALTVVFFAASGFILTSISNGTEIRADRVTPTVELARRRADTLTKSREDECRKRGDRCRDLEAQERKALADLASAREEVRATAYPQAEALHVGSNMVRTVQAAAMVAICLAAGSHHLIRRWVDLGCFRRASGARASRAVIFTSHYWC